MLTAGLGASDMSCLGIMALLISTGGLCALGIFFVIHREEQKTERLLEQKPEQQPSPIVALDTALEDWLSMLELPQLECQKRRQEVARQLSTLLIEKLMLRRCPVRPSTIDRQT